MRNLQLIYFLSARLHSRLNDRIMSFTHGRVLTFRFRTLQGAIWSSISEQTESNSKNSSFVSTEGGRQSKISIEDLKASANLITVDDVILRNQYVWNCGLTGVHDKFISNITGL